MKKLVIVATATFLLIFFALGCQNPMAAKDAAAMVKPGEDKKVHPVPGGEAPTKGDLIAGRSIKVGAVTVTNDTENLYLKYGLADGWEMTESHLAVARSPSGIPQTKKHIPIPGQFNNKMAHDPPATEYTYTIPLRESGFKAGDVLCLAAHAEVQKIDETGRTIQEESAWAAGEEGQKFEGKNWATYFGYIVRAVITVGPTGATFEIADPESRLYGFKIAIPPGAVDQQTIFHVYPTEIHHDLPPGIGVEWLGQAIALEKDQVGDFLAPVEITFPVGDAFSTGPGILLFSYDEETNKWDVPAMTDIDLEKRTITVRTLHFSWYRPGRKPWDYTPNGISFEFTEDAFPYVNTSGICSGITGFTSWYFSYVSNPPLRRSGLVRTNLTRIAVNVYELEANFWPELFTMWNKIEEWWGKEGADRQTAESIYAALVTTGRPQCVTLFRPGAQGEEHALLVFAKTAEGFLVEDPNNTTNPRPLFFNGQSFSPYGDYSIIVHDNNLGFLDSSIRSTYEANHWPNFLWYAEDFSTYPMWETSDNWRFRWDGNGAFYANRVNISSGGNYAIKDTGIDMNGASFRLEWDIKVAAVDYASGLWFGLYDTDMYSNGENGSYVFVVFANEDRGHTVVMSAMGSDDVAQVDMSPGTSEQKWLPDTWYHVALSYDSSTRQLSAQIKNRNTGATLRSLATTVTAFDWDMDRVGISDIRKGQYQVPGAEAQGYIDNVQLYIY